MIAYLWMSIFFLTFLCCAGKLCTLVGIMVFNLNKYAFPLMEALFTDEEIASVCYSVTKRSKKTPLLMEEEGILKFIL